MHATPTLSIINQSNIGCSLSKSIQQAYLQKRISFGVFECASLLESDPDKVMAVLLPGVIDSDDITIRLQTTLIEAFCWEYGIRLVKIADTKDVSKALQQCKNANENKTLKSLKNVDVNCIVIESPDELSDQDKEVIGFYQMSCEQLPQPIVQLPTD